MTALLHSKIGGIKLKKLIPEQQTTSLKLLKSADCYLQKFLKFPEIGVFHSYAELLHAALLESKPGVINFVPQPFKLRVGNRTYIPDCYYIKNGQRYIVEIKPRGEFNQSTVLLVKKKLELENIKFTVITNKSILKQEVLAINWLHIVRSLLATEWMQTSTKQHQLLTSLHHKSQQTISELIDFDSDGINEIALFRLAHMGKVKIELHSNLMNPDSRVELCT